MEITLSGTVTLVRYLQPVKAEEAISVTFFPTFTEPISSFWAKASSPIFFTVSGTDTAVAVPVYCTSVSLSF